MELIKIVFVPTELSVLNPLSANYFIFQTWKYRELQILLGAARAAAAENSVKVYSYKWEPTDPTGINSVDNSQSATGNEAGDWYTIDGRKLSGKPVQKGIYIVNGRKVAVK